MWLRRTLGDTNVSLFSATGFAGAWQSFCSASELNGQAGILVSVFPPLPFQPGLYLTATLWQDNARSYGTAIFYCSAEDPNG